MKVFCRVEHWFFILANAEQPLFFVPNFLVLKKIRINLFFCLLIFIFLQSFTLEFLHILADIYSKKKKIIIIIPTISTDFDIEPLKIIFI